jgi:invasion protein IalB
MNDSLQRALRFGVPVVLFLVGAVLGWVGHNVASPPGKQASVLVYGNWRVGCAPLSDAKGSCTLQLPVVDTQTGTAVANLILGQSPTGLKMEVTLPLDVLIIPGMGIVVGSDKIRAYHYVTCTLAGCIVAIPVDDKLLASLSNAQKAQLVFAIPNNQKPVGVSFPLKGFGEAHDAFLANEAMRHSWLRRLFS